MNDNEIVELFFQRNPDGIQAAQEKYGAYPGRRGGQPGMPE